MLPRPLEHNDLELTLVVSINNNNGCPRIDWNWLQ